MLQKKNLQHALYESIPKNAEDTAMINEINRVTAEVRGIQYIPEYPSDSNNNSIGYIDKETKESPYELSEYYWHENKPEPITSSISVIEELKQISEAAKNKDGPYDFYRKGDGPKKIKTTHDREYARLPMFVNNPTFKHKMISDDDMEPITITRDNPNSSKFYQFDSKPKNNLQSLISLVSQK